MLKLAIAGRPNTGKSTLFNALTGTRDALVHDRPGVTRDTVSGQMRDRAWTVADTAGLENAKSGIAADSTTMALDAIAKADAVLFVVDGRTGLTPADIDWARLVRRKTKAPVLLLVNKSESGKRMADVHEFYKLGFGQPILISAEHKTGFDNIYEFLDKIAPNAIEKEDSAAVPQKLKIAIMGQPNVGKSTLVNKILGEKRQIVMDAPGITRDTVKIPTNFYGRNIVLMDTAGLRRKAGVKDDVETLSAIKSLDAIEKSDVVILVVDATKNIENQALGIAARVYDAGKILCVALNKWDLVEPEIRDEKLLKLKHQFTNSFHQIIKPLILAISAETGTGVNNMFRRIYEQWDISNTDAPTSLINRIIEKLVSDRQPPMSRLKRPMKIKFARQTGRHPIKITINVGGASDIPESYTRYLRRGIATALHWEHLPITIEYKKDENPFEDKK
ncbi:MAG TPA: ribosome biogenesis GTPase Der [Candidatus Enterousia avicola]|uniref:GTPase Der n=1 Tax=Candidatus Enterousia avicola TaxID=2840787 RepID=A0A9D1MSL9_9PROT|nr:ribosome biogenesis GTPase Der [Candidatus Enterousia avicola]